MEINNKNNIVIQGKQEETNKILFEVALSFAENGHYVLYLASKPIENLKYLEKHNNDTLKKIIFMYCNTNAELAAKLIEINNWAKSPKLIIIQSMETFFNNNQLADDQLICALSFLIAALHNCVNAFATRFTNNTAFSLVSLNGNQIKKFKNMLPIFIDMYYYQNNWFDVDDISILEKLDDLFNLA